MASGAHAGTCGLLLVRHAVVVGTLLLHRILVLGTGPEARLVEASLTATQLLGMRLVGFYALENPQRPLSPGRVCTAAEDVVRQLGVNESSSRPSAARWRCLCAAARPQTERRRSRTSSLFQRVHGQVPIESLKVSWLIYGQGFRQNVMRDREAIVRPRRVGGADRAYGTDRRRAADRSRRRDRSSSAAARRSSAVAHRVRCAACSRTPTRKATWRWPRCA